MLFQIGFFAPLCFIVGQETIPLMVSDATLQAPGRTACRRRVYGLTRLTSLAALFQGGPFLVQGVQQASG